MTASASEESTPSAKDLTSNLEAAKEPNNNNNNSYNGSVLDVTEIIINHFYLTRHLPTLPLPPQRQIRYRLRCDQS